MNPSIFDVAKRAGVSIATVSRVMNNSAGVKEEKRKAVEEALSYYDYEPNQLGRGLVKGNTGLIGVYSPMDNSNMFSEGYILECLKGINKVLCESKYSLLLISEVKDYYKSNRTRPKFLSYVNQNRIDGLISLAIPSDGQLEDILSTLMDKGFPVGYIGHKFRDGGVNAYAQYKGYMTDAITRLYNKGHKKILFCPASIHQKAAVTIKSKVEGSYPGVQIWICDIEKIHSVDEMFICLNEVAQALDYSAILFQDSNKISMIEGALLQMGKSIPKDVSLITVEHEKGKGKLFVPEVDAYYVPTVVMAEYVARHLLQVIEEKDFTGSSQIYYAEYQDRDSVESLVE